MSGRIVRSVRKAEGWLRWGDMKGMEWFSVEWNGLEFLGVLSRRWDSEMME